LASTETWLVDPPSPFAPIEVVEQWLFDADLAIEATKSTEEREALEKAKRRVAADLRARRGSGIFARMNADE
jgi:hypothetical protein